MLPKQPHIFLTLDEDAPLGTLPERFEYVAACLPQQPAIVTKDSSWTYAQVDEKANDIASAILSKTSTGEGCVSLLFPHCAELIISMLAVLKAGKAYLVLHTDIPAESRLELLKQATPDIILTFDHTEIELADDLTAFAPLLDLTDFSEFSATPTEKPILSPESAAAIYYTSGSTGQAKGVVKNHAAILHRAWIYTRNADISPADRQSLLTDCSFAASEVDIFGALLNGASLCLFDLRRRSLSDFLDWINDEAISLLHPPVTFFRRFLRTLEAEQQILPVRLVALAGERIEVSDQQRWCQHFPKNSIMLQRFSASETGVLTVRRVTQEEEAENNAEHLGYPVPDKVIWVAGPDGKLLDQGQTGEIIVSSRYLATGYWRNLELTKLYFSADPERPGWTHFRTGDLGYFLPNGALVLQGRGDHQVKIRGYRVELGEIEIALRALDNILEAAVIATVIGETKLIAFVVFVKNTKTDVTGIRRQIRNKLADWKLPSKIHTLSELPLTPTGKIDRQRLLQLHEHIPQASPSLSEANTLDDRLTQLWCQALELQIHDLDIEANFFDLGGDSISAMIMLANIKKEFSINVSPELLYRLGTLQTFRNQLHDFGQSKSEATVVALRKRGSLPPLIVAPRLQGDTLWCTYLFPYLNPEQPVYALVTPTDRQFKCLEDLAAYFAEALLKQQSNSKFRLLGYSFGGKLVYEIACQLAARGRDTEFLGVLDAPAQRREYNMRRLGRMIIGQGPQWILNLYWYFLDYFILVSPEERLATLRNTGLIVRRVWKIYINKTHQDNWEQLDSDSNYLLLPPALQQATKMYIDLFRKYQPQPYDGSLNLFRVRSTPLLQPLSKDYGWGELVQHRVKVTFVKGANHINLIDKQHSSALANALNQTLSALD